MTPLALALEAIERDGERTRRERADARPHGTMPDGTPNPDWLVSGLPSLITHLKKGDASFIAFAANHLRTLATAVIEMSRVVEAARGWHAAKCDQHPGCGDPNRGGAPDGTHAWECTMDRTEAALHEAVIAALDAPPGRGE